MKTKKLNARASAYANSVEPEDNKNNDACWMAARRGYIAGWKARKEKKSSCLLVELFGSDIIPVTEEAARKSNDVIQQKPIAVKCDTEEQFRFVGIILFGQEMGGFGNMAWGGGVYDCVCDEGKQYSKWFESEDYNVMPFTTYIADNHLESEWNAFRSLKPEDLEDGEIYVMQAQKVHLFRFERNAVDGYVRHYSWLSDTFHLNGNIYIVDSDRICRHATLPEKLKLIEQELRHGYDHSKK